MFHSAFARLVVAGAACLALALPAAAARQQAPPTTHLAAATLGNVEQLVLPAIDAEGLLRRADTKVSTSPGPLEYADPFLLDLTPAANGTWESLPTGERLWRLRIDAPGATDLNLGFAEFRLPADARLTLRSEDTEYQVGPYTAADNEEHGQLWTPVVPGSRAVIELVMPNGSDDYALRLTQVSRGFRRLFGDNADNAKQGSCNNDVICSVGDGWRNEIRSVQRFSVGGSGLCTGTLVMDVPRDYRNFMLSANHCGVNSSNDASIVTYFNFQAPTCGQLSGGSLSQSLTGTNFRAARSDVDMLLVELDDAIPAGYNPYYAGWDNSGSAPSRSVVIHHPSGDEKAITFDEDPLTTMNSCIGTGGTSTHWRVGDYEDGTTEPGSSGSGIWSQTTRLIVGFLSGGAASCSVIDYDCFGKMSVAWNGSSASQRLKDWLDPASTGASSVAGSNPGGGGGGGGAKDKIYYVAASAHFPGVAFFQTDARIFNRGTATANMDIFFLPEMTNSVASVFTLTVPPRSSRAIGDLVFALYGKTDAGALLFASDQELAISTNTYAVTTTGTFGQAIPGVGASAAKLKQVIPNLLSNAIFRSNVGVLNINNANATVTIVVKSASDIGTGAVTLGSKSVVLGPYGWTQDNNIIAELIAQHPEKASSSNAWAEVTSNVPVLAYGSTIDGRTSDPIYIAGIPD